MTMEMHIYQLGLLLVLIDTDVVGCTDGGDAELGLVAACNYDETAT